MKRSLKLLRWAASVVGVMGVVLFGVLWVRSYWRGDQVTIPLTGQRSFMVISLGGAVSWQRTIWRPDWTPSWDVTSYSVAMIPKADAMDLLQRMRQVRFSRTSVRLPHWLLMLACATIGAAPWLRWRFSVRGVLILVAFVAAMFAILIFE